MKRITFFIALLIIAIASKAQTNLVQNHSFENGFTNWSKGANSSYTAPDIMTSGAQDGNNYAQYTSATATTGFYQNIAITGGKTYTITFWYKATGDGTDARIWSFLLDADGKTVYTTDDASTDPLRNNNEYLDPATEWTKHEVTFTAPSNVVTLQLAVRAYNGATAAFDNFSVTEQGVSTPTLTALPTSLDFSLVVGSTESKTITVSGINLSAAPTYQLNGDGASMFSVSGSLTTDGGELSVVFSPTSSGVKYATLTITSGNAEAVVNLTGTATDASNPYGLDDSAPISTLNETFGTTAGAIVLPWKSVAVVGDRNWEVKVYSDNAYAQMSAFSGTGDYQTLLISPAINFDAITKDAIRFDWKSGYTAGAELNVYVMSKDGTKSLVKSINDNSNPSAYGTDFITETLDLSAFSGINFLVFEYVGSAAAGTTTTYQIDNVVITSLTGLTSTQIKSLSIWSSNNQIHFNASANENVSIYNTLGQLQYAGITTEGVNSINIESKGVVIVKVGNRIGKTIL